MFNDFGWKGLVSGLGCKRFCLCRQHGFAFGVLSTKKNRLLDAGLEKYYNLGYNPLDLKP